VAAAAAPQLAVPAAAAEPELCLLRFRRRKGQRLRPESVAVNPFRAKKKT